MAWADTDNEVYQIEINEINRQATLKKFRDAAGGRVKPPITQVFGF